VADDVRVTFLFALGQRVRWRGEPDARWRVIERSYREDVVRRDVRYLLQSLSDRDRVTVYEPDLSPEEDEHG
jgi:hypothetical protein